jgi:hypothetical protein
MRTEREKIEAELRMTEEEKAIANARRAIGNVQEFDAMLCRLEALSGLPLFYRSKPIPERLKALGFPSEVIEDVNLMVDALEANGNGRAMPERAKAMLAEQAAAEQSALDQLAAIVNARSRRD